ncbi:hypothetical protein OEZ86_005745 [Tetradesmus obliquus]|nr:hypothetical protein OEZ86_005745 [Tetradesmus obliquus]
MEPVAYEPASDGLAFCKHPQRGMLSWLRGYTRAGCRCGQCPLGQEEPCEYALPESPSFIAKTCSAVYSRAGSVVHMTHGGLVRVMSLHQPVQRSTAALKQSSD